MALRVSTIIRRSEPPSCPFLQGRTRMQIVRPEHRPGSAGHEPISTGLERFTRRREKRLPRRLAGPVVAVCLSAATSSLRGRYPVVACLVADALSAAGRPTGIGG